MPKHTVLLLIKSRPSLYRNRLDALKAIFDSPKLTWKNGNLVFVEKFDMEKHYVDFCQREKDCIREAQDAYNDALSAFLIDESCTNRWTKESTQQNLLAELAKKRNNLFVFENAEMLSDFNSRTRFTESPGRFSGLHFDDMPDDVSFEWKEAAKELAWNIISHQFIAISNRQPEENEKDLLLLLESKQICHQFLEQVGDSLLTPEDRPKRINALKREIKILAPSKQELKTKVKK